MIRRQTPEGVQWLEFDLLAEFKELSHGVFTRQGGVSEAPYTGLNVCSTHGDSPYAVEQNHSKIASALALPKLYSIKQVHGSDIVHVSDKDSDPTRVGDAMVTTVPRKALMIQHADCQVALLYDPVCKVIAAVHSGWRGNVQNIYAKVIEYLKALGSNPANILVGISPSLGPCHAEFIHYRKELPESFWQYQIKPYYFDLWAVAQSQLLAAGVLPHHIEIARLCTYANKPDFFSYRRDKICGRNGTVIALR